MCGRYYVDDETAREIERIIRIADEKVRQKPPVRVQAKDIHPTDIAPVLLADGEGIGCRLQKWGLPGYDAGQVIFNARSETAAEKKSFREGVENRRLVVPATWFYEWNRAKEKNLFRRKDQKVLFMAGIYNRCQGEDRFVILTTAANASMEPVHDRMPLILEPEEISDWIFEREKAKRLLHKVPCLLERRTEFEQLTLF